MLTEGWCVMDKHSMMLSSTKAKCSKHGRSKQPGVQLFQQQHRSLALAMRIPVRHEKVTKQRWHQHPPPHPLVPVVQRLLLCRTLKYLSLKKAFAELHHKLRGEQAGLCCSANIPQLCTAESGKSLSQLQPIGSSCHSAGCCALDGANNPRPGHIWGAAPQAALPEDCASIHCCDVVRARSAVSTARCRPSTPAQVKSHRTT